MDVKFVSANIIMALLPTSYKKKRRQLSQICVQVNIITSSRRM